MLYMLSCEISKQLHKRPSRKRQRHKRILEMRGGFAGTDALSEAALASMDALCTQLENMEVYENVAN